MSTPAIVAIVVVGLLTVAVVVLRVEVAKQRGRVAAVRARLAAAGPTRQRAEGVQVEGLFHMRSSVGRSTRTATCTRTDDGFYCLSDDGHLGWRIPFPAGRPLPGDMVLAATPSLVKDGTVIGDAPDWMRPWLPSLASEGLLLQVQGGSMAWMIALPNAEEWYAALMLSHRGSGSTPPTATT